jgi:hypothetical protein
MKKLLIAAVAATSLMATTVSALELGVTTSRDYANDHRTGYGLSVGEQFGKFGVAAGFQRFTKGEKQDMYSVTGSYDVVTVGPAVVSAKVGGVYLDNDVVSNGYAVVAGAGVDFPINQTVTVGVDVVHQRGQDRVKDFDGNRVTAALKFNF